MQNKTQAWHYLTPITGPVTLIFRGNSTLGLGFPILNPCITVTKQSLASLLPVRSLKKSASVGCQHAVARQTPVLDRL